MSSKPDGQTIASIICSYNVFILINILLLYEFVYTSDEPLNVVGHLHSFYKPIVVIKKKIYIYIDNFYFGI